MILIFSPPAAPSEGEIRMKNEGIIHHNQLYYRQGERNKSVNTTQIFSSFKQLKYFYTIFIIHREQVLQIADYVRKGRRVVREWLSDEISPLYWRVFLFLCSVWDTGWLCYGFQDVLYYWLTRRKDQTDETVWLLRRLCRTVELFHNEEISQIINGNIFPMFLPNTKYCL